ncbi:hypothetical protein F5B19DRAFT_504334 [Rostrohypoxylon terebratum]|nr:hypothetical protein F5B19DRAFT_504334 [Rostrohypoxylon terebratum]
MPTRRREVRAIPNNQVPFFRLPLELRLIIYEFAVAVPKAIRPKQVADGANKFVWGSYIDNLRHGVYPDQAVLVNTEHSRLNVVALSRVSKMIYNELKTYPVFYWINSFQFDRVQDLHVFLSAITPERREAIRYLELDLQFLEGGNLDDVWKSYFASWTNRVHLTYYPNLQPGLHPEPFVFSLLSQCTAIKQFSIRLSTTTEPVRLGELAAIPIDEISVWNLPFVQVSTELSNGEIFTFGKSATVPDSVLKTIWEENLNDDELANPDYEEHIRQTQALNSAMLNRRQRVAAKGTPILQWFVDLKKQNLIEEAIGAARVDFPGEIRVSQDRLQSTVGPISSRTRRKGTWLDADLGALRQYSPKYNLDGSLILWSYEVRDIRWSKTGEIECHLFYDEPDRPLVASWENVEKVVFSPPGERALYEHMDGIFWYAVNVDYQNRDGAIGRLKDLPSPHDVFALVGGLRKVLTEAYEDYGVASAYLETRIDDWLLVKSAWDMWVTRGIVHF